MEENKRRKEVLQNITDSVCRRHSKYMLFKYVDSCIVCITHTATNSKGYGQLYLKGKVQKLHRIVYEAVKGEIPVGLLIRHSCHNPKCCNPEHLSVGTDQDNADDKMKAGRYSCPVGSSNYLSTLSKEDILDIRTKRMSCGMFGKLYNVHKTTISKIQLRKTYKDIA